MYIELEGVDPKAFDIDDKCPRIMNSIRANLKVEDFIKPRD
jgi:hypothetical protein